MSSGHHRRALAQGDRGFESLYPSKRLSAGRHCRLAGPGRPAGSRPRIPVFLSTWSGPAPRQVGRHGSPVGGCASSASTGIDARRGGPGWSDARGGPSMAEEIAWFVGIDWASQSHQVCLVDARRECLGERAVAHGGAGIEELCDWLMARTGATPEVIGVAIEMTQGPVVEALLERGFCVYGINPKQLDRFRDRFTVAGATLPPQRP